VIVLLLILPSRLLEISITCGMDKSVIGRFNASQGPNTPGVALRIVAPSDTATVQDFPCRSTPGYFPHTIFQIGNLFPALWVERARSLDDAGTRVWELAQCSAGTTSFSIERMRTWLFLRILIRPQQLKE
jgi:hypothetical protein